MAELLALEREAMLAMAMDRLGEVVARKETLALRLKALDESRRALARRLASLCGASSDQLTISDLCQSAPPFVAAELRRSGQRLREAVLNCQSINDFNARAARRGLQLVGDVIHHLIDQADPTGKLYEAPRPRPKGYAGSASGRGSALGGGFISRKA